MRSCLPTISGVALPPGFQILLEAVDGTITLRPTGELDLATGPHLADALRQAQASAARVVVLDLQGLTFMDVSGMRVILDAQDHAQSEGPGLETTGCPIAVQRVFDLCRMIGPSLGCAPAAQSVPGR